MKGILWCAWLGLTLLAGLLCLCDAACGQEWRCQDGRCMLSSSSRGSQLSDRAAGDVLWLPQPGYSLEQRVVTVPRPLPPVPYQRTGFAVIAPRVLHVGPFWWTPDVGRCNSCGGIAPQPRMYPVYSPLR